MMPLEDIKILDLSNGLTCSLATMYLTSFGAEVTKLEKPESGDSARKWSPSKDEESYYFNYLNSGKKSITVDIEKEEGQKIFKKILPMFDVVCVNSTPGKMEALGLGYEQLKEIKEDIIYASCTPFGLEGPLSCKPAASLTAQAFGVAMDMTGVVDGYPVSSAPALTEHYAAGYLAAGILLAVIDKQTKGIGQVVDISLQDSIFSCIETAPSAASTVGEVQTRKGNFDPSCAPYDSFKTNDGYVTIGVATQAQWEKFCDAMDIGYLKEDPRFLTNEQRCDDYPDSLRAVLAEILENMSKFDIENKCRAQGIPCCAVLAVDEITDMPNTVENGFVLSKESVKLGNVKFPSLPFSLSETPSKVFADAPELGENTDEILKQAGISEDEISVKRQNNIV